jgi:hypothetical protein
VNAVEPVRRMTGQTEITIYSLPSLGLTIVDTPGLDGIDGNDDEQLVKDLKS